MAAISIGEPDAAIVPVNRRSSNGKIWKKPTGRTEALVISFPNRVDRIIQVRSSEPRLAERLLQLCQENSHLNTHQLKKLCKEKKDFLAVQVDEDEKTQKALRTGLPTPRRQSILQFPSTDSNSASATAVPAVPAVPAVVVAASAVDKQVDALLAAAMNRGGVICIDVTESQQQPPEQQQQQHSEQQKQQHDCSSSYSSTNSTSSSTSSICVKNPSQDPSKGRETSMGKIGGGTHFARSSAACQQQQR
eukprot:TRINITY_DN15045_c0_g1_i1.p1 TRINITY_DN15045_c0_g1~~TRINITY_DN15045_c0_g1_i1.p1  ORF type:complete len:248 (-),score=69.78 TRINITY_DN15045_c0_g1_i1:625-1368(-)